MTMLRRPTAAAVVALCLLLPVGPALASGSDVILDCNDHGHLTKTYSQKEYRQALAQMPADVRQYTDCEDIIRRAQLGEAPTTDAAANTANPFGSAPPAEVAKAQQDIAAARKTGGAGQRIAGDVVYPGALSYTKVSAAVSELPTPLVVLIALIVVGALALLIPKLQARRRGDGGA
jgi:hypothetical protein